MRSLPDRSSVISLRPAAPADDEQLAALSEHAFAEYQAMAGRYVMRTRLRCSTRTWVAAEGDKIVGMVVLDGVAGEWWVLAIAVAAQARARGIGGRLLATAEAYAADRGASRLSLFTADSNLAALDLFLRRGFRIVSRKRRFYSRHQDACKLSKLLGTHH